MRLNKYLAERGVASRRACDELAGLLIGRREQVGAPAPEAARDPGDSAQGQ